MRLEAQNKLMTVPSRDLIFRRSPDTTIKYMHILDGQTLRHNQGAQIKHQGNVLRFYSSSLYLTLFCLVGFKFGFSYLSL